MLTIPINQHATTPIYEQIYTYIKNEIITGTMKRNEKLPSTRSLATNLQVSRNTIDMAYSQLISEGYIDSLPKKGYFVNDIAHLKEILISSDVASSPMPSYKPAPTNQDSCQYDYDFSPFSIDLNNFPYHTWQKLSKTCLYNGQELFLLGDKQGDLCFRQAIQSYLHQSRGVQCHPDQIIIGAGADYLLQLLAQLFSSDTMIGMENPTYKQAYQIFHGHNFPIVPISLDANGLTVDELAASCAKIAYVTPSHQYPLGIVMPIKRRLELLEWAKESKDRFIIEDDHDSEFRYKGKPIPALQGIDTSSKVIYMGTFSRSIAPAIRIGYMVLPAPLLERYYQTLGHYSSTVSRLDQTLMTTFLQDGYFERHLNRMRTIYKNKHDVLLGALKCFGKTIHLHGEHAGLHLVIKFHTCLSEKEILDLAKESRIKLYPLSSHYIKPPTDPYPGFLLGYANMSEESIKDGVNALYQALKGYL